MPRVVLTRTARSNLDHLSEPLQDAVEITIDTIAAAPRTAGKPLIGRLVGLWSARVGNYRVIYSIDDRANQVVVRAIQHRAAAYKGRKRR